MTEIIFLIIIAALAVALAMHRAPLWLWALAGAAALIAHQSGVLHGTYATPSPGLLGILAWVPVLALALLWATPAERLSLAL